eukprot:3888306-Lingulodinium_polyedra.AAC.1
MAAMVWLATDWRPGLAAAERAVGRAGYAHMFRPCLRASVSAVYAWIQQGRAARAHALLASASVTTELA